MPDYILYGGTFPRPFTSAALSLYGAKLIASSQSYFKVDGVAVTLLSKKGYLLVVQVDGTGSGPARTLFENYNFSWNSTYEHNVQLTAKDLSGTFTLSAALEAHSYLGLAPLTDLATLHALVYSEPPPGPPRQGAPAACPTA